MTDPLFVTDEQLIELMGCGPSLGKALIRQFEDKHPTFPRKQELYGGRRYMPAVRAWFDARNGLKMAPSETARRDRYVR